MRFTCARTSFTSALHQQRARLAFASHYSDKCRVCEKSMPGRKWSLARSLDSPERRHQSDGNNFPIAVVSQCRSCLAFASTPSFSFLAWRWCGAAAAAAAVATFSIQSSAASITSAWTYRGLWLALLSILEKRGAQCDVTSGVAGVLIPYPFLPILGLGFFFFFFSF